MNERERLPALPEATPEFTDAILAGAERIRRYERRRRRTARTTLAVAVCAVLALALGAAVLTLSRPRQDRVALAANPEGAGPGAALDGAEAGATLLLGETIEPEGDVSQLVSERELQPEGTVTPIDGGAPFQPEEAEVQINGEEGTRPEAASALTGAVEVNEEGVERLTVQGPYKPGQRLVLTDHEGDLIYGLIIKLYENPSLPSRSVHAVAGMQVVYQADMGNGFAQVSFAGREVYVEQRFLRLGAALPELEDGQNWVIDEAQLYLTGSTGKVEMTSIDGDDPVKPYALKKLLCALEPADPADYADAPLGALLVVFVRDADAPAQRAGDVEKDIALRFAMPRDGTVAMLAEDGSVYVAPEAEAPYFWNIFPNTAEKLW